MKIVSVVKFQEVPGGSRRFLGLEVPNPNQNGRSRPEEPVAQGQNLQNGISNLPLT